MAHQKALLFNASNMETFPVYPYAFIQVPAVARRVGIEVVCQDLLGIPRERWQPTVQALIDQHDPAMILITLRNTDTLSSQDYEAEAVKKAGRSAYFPIERTRELIAAIRAISALKIVVGGFGFSLLPEELMHDLRPDYGVAGEPEDFFLHFEEIRNGVLHRAANLLYFQEEGLVMNPRKYYPPLAEAEYTPQAVEAMLAFYAAFPSPGFQGAPVEIMRGCSHSCVFCAEPHSKGAKVRYRSPDAVMKDVEILVENGVTRLYLVSSELNPEGNEFILELADRIGSFNQLQAEDRKVTWYGANYLLSFEYDEYERLYRSGFTGGWFDITALDDENARAMRTPYRNARLLAHLKAYVRHQKTRRDRRKQEALGSGAKVAEGDVHEDELRWTFFLGNPATTAETIRDTFRIANREGLADCFDGCGLINNIRVFDYEGLGQAAMAATYSVNLDLSRAAYQQLLPSFVYPPALLVDFSEEEIRELFDYIAETYLSRRYRQTRDWDSFIDQSASTESISRWLAELSRIKRMGEIQAAAGWDARDTVDFLVTTCLEAFPGFFESLGLPDTAEKLEQATPYALALAVFSRWESAEDLLEKIQAVIPVWKREFLKFCVLAMLYRFNIQIKPKYRQLFSPP